MWSTDPYSSLHLRGLPDEQMESLLCFVILNFLYYGVEGQAPLLAYDQKYAEVSKLTLTASWMHSDLYSRGETCASLLECSLKCVARGCQSWSYDETDSICIMLPGLNQFFFKETDENDLDYVRSTLHYGMYGSINELNIFYKI